jgi:hypothetical protein
MKNIYTLLGLFCFLSAAAQPTFTSDNCFHAGMNSTIGWTFWASSYQDQVLATSGNQSWDFSSQNWSLPAGEYIFQTGAESGSSTFAQSEINEYGLTTFTRDLYYTYSSDNDTLYYDGISTGASDYQYNEGIPYLTFPLDFEDSLYHHQVLFALIGGTPTEVGSTTRTWIYDGYGDLNLGYGMQEDVFRIRTKQIDSTYITGFAVTYEEIIWMRASDGLPVLRFQNQGGMISVYYAGVDGNVFIESVNEETIAVYPNPTNDTFKIQGANPKSIMLIDALGRIAQLDVLNTGLYSIAGVETGVYMLVWIDENGTYHSAKLLKE